MFKAFLDFLLPASSKQPKQKAPPQLPHPEPIPTLEDLEEAAWQDLILIIKFVLAIFVGVALGTLISHLYYLFFPVSTLI